MLANAFSRPRLTTQQCNVLGPSDCDPAGLVWAASGLRCIVASIPRLSSILDRVLWRGTSTLTAGDDSRRASMAATPFEPSFAGASLFNIYNDGAGARNNLNLPGGACNFVDLNAGAYGARCGCRRFWSCQPVAGRTYPDNLVSDRTAWCMCNHHACYHEHAGAAEASPAAITAGQENEKPRSAREPLSPVQDLSFRIPTGMTPILDLPSIDGTFYFPSSDPEEAVPIRQSLQSAHAEPSLPDTLSLGDFLNSQPGQHTLPPIPSQCLMPPSQSTSTTSNARYLRPFAGRGLQTLSGVSASKVRTGVEEKPHDIGPAAQQTVGSSALTLHGDTGVDTPRAAQSPEPTDRLATTSPFLPGIRHLSETVNGHEQRLDRLETVSFTATGHEECNDKHDQMDLRVTDLEVRLDEVEKGMNDSSSHGTSRRSTHRDVLDESASSVVSVSTNATDRIITTSEIYSHMQSLEARFNQIQSALPSIHHPWELEVVFLPFPLKRVWQEIHGFKAESMSDADEWTQLPNSNSSTTLRAQSPIHSEWAGPDHQFEWLLPRACAVMSIPDQRLRSRGLIRTISVKGSDARSFQAAMLAAFGNLLQEMAAAPSPGSRRWGADLRVAKFLGLQQPWVPLRKVHKDSRLRFLSPDEMVTPALWNKAFLDSVIMRCSKPRLFVTQPDAYLQDYRAYEFGWTWQKIRELPRFYPESQASQEVPEGDAMEECWMFNEQCDDLPSAQSSQSSLSLRQARQRVSSSPSQPLYTGLESLRSISPVVARGQAPIKERRTSSSRSLYIRTTSMPPTLPAPFSPAQNRRRIVSNGQQQPKSPRSGTPQARTSSSIIAKRRRTRSPSHPRNTPRWTASPSPMPQGGPSEGRQSVARGTTPFFYATPYSNAPLMETRPQRGSGGMDDRGDASDEDDGHHPSHGSSTNAEDDDESVISVEMVTRLGANRAQHDSQDLEWPLPEDEPWPGIEEHMSDGENIDPMDENADGDIHSEASSRPSEYPSTRQAWHLPGAGTGAGFHIHEDEEGVRRTFP
jgi:hypothetical protein